MLDSDQWKGRVVKDSQTLCPACASTNVTMGACAIGSITVHQEYLCEECQHEFTALFALVGCYTGQPNVCGRKFRRFRQIPSMGPMEVTC